MEQQARNGKDGTAPVPRVARLLRDGQGKFMYVGDSASLSFLQSIRRVVSSAIGHCEFTEDPSRHSMLEVFQSNLGAQSSSLIPPPSNEAAQQFARQYVLATSPLLDLFDLDEFYPRLTRWVENSSGDDDTARSIFYLVLAIGAQVTGYNQTLAEQYFNSGSQLALSAFQETPSVYTIQSYILVSMYMLGACRRNGAFMNLGVALRAGYTIGIHRKDANALFCARECRERERAWKSLRMMDLYLSASLGRPPATSDYEGRYIRDDIPAPEKEEEKQQQQQQQNPTPSEQLSAAVISLCRIFERILNDIYMKQVVSVNTAEAISDQHRAWVRTLPPVLTIPTGKSGNDSMEDSLAAAHVFGSYYWSIILLTRPFLVYHLTQYVKKKGDTSSSRVRPGDSRISLFADACVYSGLRALDVMDDLSRFSSLPRRLPFLINSVFNSAIVLGAAFFADYDNVLPLEEGMNKAERFLGLFVPHDPHACRFYQIIKYLRAAVVEYVQRRNRELMDRRSRQVDQLFGQVGGGNNGQFPTRVPPEHGIPSSVRSEFQRFPPANSPNLVNKLAQGTALSFFATPQPRAADLRPPSRDVSDSLYNGSDEATACSYDTAISALTTSGIPVNCSPGGSIPSGQAGIPGGPSPLSDVMLPDNGLLYAAEDLPGFRLWDNVSGT